MSATVSKYDVYNCPVGLTIELISGKWKPIILYLVQHGVNRFGMLQKKIPGISKKILTGQLRALEKHGLLDRDVIVSKPPQEVVYSLTEKGRSLRGLIDEICNWGVENMLDDGMKKRVREILRSDESLMEV
jgi:DNA-binding HxlR family transcriptional regulator